MCRPLAPTPALPRFAGEGETVPSPAKRGRVRVGARSWGHGG
ncbi:hypothetical protein [Azospirillum doebereinerae]